MEILLTTLILLIAPDCSDDMVDTLRHDLGYNNTGYEEFISPHYEVACMGGVDILSVEAVTVPLLRDVFPDNPIVFVYGKQQEWDYTLYVANKYGMHYYFGAVAGNADVSLGYALASYNHIEIQHERTHIEMCAAHGHGSNPYDPFTWTRVMERKWCTPG